MTTLYHCLDARSFRPLWALEELQLPYQLEVMPFPPRVHRKEFLGINPLGTIPYLVDGNVRMTESSAICLYLCSRVPGSALQVLPHEPGYGDFLQWLHFGEATLTFPQTLVLRYGYFEPPERRQPTVAQDYLKWFMARLRGPAAVLERSEWMAGGRFTVADISVGYALLLSEVIGVRAQWPAPVQAYWDRLCRRPAFLRAKAAQEQAARAQGVPLASLL